MAPPRLLVSVRNKTEALAAVRGGADIIDVKEPTAGSLGMASPTAMAEVAQTLAESAPQLPCSVALGELLDRTNADVLSIPQTIHWFKMGLSGCRHDPDWIARWLSLRKMIRSSASCIAVAYVDAEAAASPSIQHVMEAAIETRCAGLLLDTFSKSTGTLLDKVSIPDLSAIVRAAHAAGLLIALAGRVRREDVPALLATEPDVIAVRSAVCCDQYRTAMVDERLVREFLTAITSMTINRSVPAR